MTRRKSTTKKIRSLAFGVTFILVIVVSIALANRFVHSDDSEPQGEVAGENSPEEPSSEDLKPVVKTDKEWRSMLTRDQFRVTRKKGTERAFTGKYWDNKKDGIYACVCCGLPLFDAATKFKSDTGWPSFWTPFHGQHVAEEEDKSFFSIRTEVKCQRCDAHLGHVFDDGPRPTGLRYCVNSAALDFHTREEQSGQEKPDGE